MPDFAVHLFTLLISRQVLSVIISALFSGFTKPDSGDDLFFLAALGGIGADVDIAPVIITSRN